jgi:MFS superfamily sulfate permease-like transporter
VLAAVMLVAVARLVDLRGLVRLFRASKRDFALSAISALAVLLLGMLWGVVAAVALSLLDLLERATVPHTVAVGRIPGTAGFGSGEPMPRQEQIDGVLVVRVYASVLFANAHAVEEEVLERARAYARPLRLVVLDLEPSPLLDHSAAEMLAGLRASLEWEGTRLEIAGASARARRMLYEEAPDAFAAVEEGADVGRLVRAWLSHQVTSPY